LAYRKFFFRDHEINQRRPLHQYRSRNGAAALRHPAVTAAVVGARSAAEITTDASYLTLDIPDELFAALATVLRH
jgi:hypothetical protein